MSLNVWQRCQRGQIRHELEETREFMKYDVLFLRASPDKMLSRDSFFTRAFCF